MLDFLWEINYETYLGQKYFAATDPRVLSGDSYINFRNAPKHGTSGLRFFFVPHSSLTRNEKLHPRVVNTGTFKVWTFERKQTPKMLELVKCKAEYIKESFTKFSVMRDKIFSRKKWLYENLRQKNFPAKSSPSMDIINRSWLVRLYFFQTATDFGRRWWQEVFIISQTIYSCPQESSLNRKFKLESILECKEPKDLCNNLQVPNGI